MAKIQKEKENGRTVNKASSRGTKSKSSINKKNVNNSAVKASKGSIEAQVINIVKSADKLMGVQAIRLALVGLGRKDGAALKKRLKEVLEKLTQQKRSDFAKIKESYYAGADSQVGKEPDKKEAEKKRLKELENWYQCAWCD